GALGSPSSTRIAACTAQNRSPGWLHRPSGGTTQPWNGRSTPTGRASTPRSARRPNPTTNPPTHCVPPRPRHAPKSSSPCPSPDSTLFGSVREHHLHHDDTGGQQGESTCGGDRDGRRSAILQAPDHEHRRADADEYGQLCEYLGGAWFEPSHPRGRQDQGGHYRRGENGNG